MSHASQTDSHDTHGGHEHPSFLAHHFETPQQQFDSGKLGIWLFLSTEILLFSGLFCAYSIYRANHPEIFEYAHLYLDKIMGGINTVVLITSSLTMAWAVRAAQMGQKKLLSVLLALTILCGFGFLGIKYVEYKHKWESGLLWGVKYDPKHGPHEAHASAAGVAEHKHPVAENAKEVGAHAAASAPAGHEPAGHVAAAAAPVSTPSTAPAVPPGYIVEQSTIPQAASGPAGTVTAVASEAEAHRVPDNVHIFFGIYFVMTGLHGVHVVAGMVAIGWILKRSLKGEFTKEYFFPVDFVGLYWHVVDLVWIFLFPLLYLIS